MLAVAPILPFQGHVPIYSSAYETLIKCSNLQMSCIDHALQVQLAIRREVPQINTFIDYVRITRNTFDNIDYEIETELYENVYKEQYLAHNHGF